MDWIKLILLFWFWSGAFSGFRGCEGVVGM